MFQLISLYATAPRFDPAFFEQYQARLRSVAEFYAAEPDSVLFDTVNTVLSQGHFRARPLTVELIEELSLDAPAPCTPTASRTWAMPRSYSWARSSGIDLRSLAETYLASLPTSGRAESWQDRGVDPPPGIEDHVVRSGIEPRSNSVLVYAGDMEWSREEALRLRRSQRSAGDPTARAGAGAAGRHLQHICRRERL